MKLIKIFLFLLTIFTASFANALNIVNPNNLPMPAGKYAPAVSDGAKVARILPTVARIATVVSRANNVVGWIQTAYDGLSSAVDFVLDPANNSVIFIDPNAVYYARTDIYLDTGKTPDEVGQNNINRGNAKDGSGTYSYRNIVVNSDKSFTINIVRNKDGYNWTIPGLFGNPAKPDQPTSAPLDKVAEQLQAKADAGNVEAQKLINQVVQDMINNNDPAIAQALASPDAVPVPDDQPFPDDSPIPDKTEPSPGVKPIPGVPTTAPNDPATTPDPKEPANDPEYDPKPNPSTNPGTSPNTKPVTNPRFLPDGSPNPAYSPDKDPYGNPRPVTNPEKKPDGSPNPNYDPTKDPYGLPKTNPATNPKTNPDGSPNPNYDPTKDPTNPAYVDPATIPVGSTSPNTNTNTNTSNSPKFELPPFCSWASKVCEWIDWTKKEWDDMKKWWKDEPKSTTDDDEHITEDERIDMRTAEKDYVHFPAFCPPNPTFAFLGGTLTFPMDIICRGVEMMKYVITAFAYLKGLFIIGNAIRN